MSGGIDYLVDTSAAARWSAKIGVAKWSRIVEAGRVGMCDITELEMLYSAQSSTHRSHVLDVLTASFPWVPMPDQVYARAREVQALLTERGWHRSAGPVDLLLAATAELSSLALLHQDHDFETIARVTGQETRWLLSTDRVGEPDW